MLVFVLAFAEMATSPGNAKNMNVTFVLLEQMDEWEPGTERGGLPSLGTAESSSSVVSRFPWWGLWLPQFQMMQWE